MFSKAFPYLIAGALLVSLVLLSDLTPWMPPMGAMVALLVAAVLLVLFAGFVMQENGGDERDLLHRLNAGRIAYLSGIGVLTTALVVQGFQHAIDPWVLFALGAMVVAKAVAHYYSDRYQ